jgi:hypothetical protein
MAIASGNFAELLWPGLAEIWANNYNDFDPLYTKIFNVKQSKQRFEKEQGVTGLPLAAVKDEGGAIPYVDPFQGYQQEYVNVTYALGATVTREMYEDELYNYINSLPGALSRSIRQTEETVAFNHLNRAFNASFTGPDGSVLCGNAHAHVGGGTSSNILATAADLTQTSLETLSQNLLDAVDDQNLKIRLQPVCLVVPTALNFTARKLLETDLVVGAADNDINPIRGLFKDMVVSPYLSDTDAWFITTDSPNGLTWYNRRDAQIGRDNEFDTENLKFKVTERFSSGWTNFRGVYGTPGAA